jgi:methanogenic corrinoid protein MtbC1
VNRVSEAGKIIRDAIESRRNELAKAIVEQQWKTRPDLERRYGTGGFSKCLEDANFHLRYLSEAIEASEPKLFVDYIAWAKVMLASRNVPSEDFASHLEVLRDVLADALPSEMRESVRRYINSALDYLPGHQSQVPSFLEDGSPLTEIAKSYLTALLRYERHVAIRLVLDAVDAGSSVKDIYCFVFERCQREIGRLWQLNLATVAQEHYCTASTQLAMALLYPRMFAQKRTTIGTLVAACVPGELHEIGPRLVCDLLEMEGWDTTYLGANVPVAALLETVKARRPDILAISASMTFHVPAVRQLITALRGADMASTSKILVGGHVFRFAPDLWRDVGADGFAKDALETIELLKELHR